MESSGTGRTTRHDHESKKHQRVMNMIGFWILGLCNNFGYVVMLSDANDILSEFTEVTNGTKGARDCNYVSTGAILLADIVPSLLVKMVTISIVLYHVHIMMMIGLVLAAAGFISVALAYVDWLVYLGVVFTALSCGLGEVTLLGYMSFYDKSVVSTYSSGTGAAGLFGSLSFALFTMMMTPRQAVLSMTVIVVVEAIAFWAMISHPKTIGGFSIFTTFNLVGESLEQVQMAQSFGEKVRIIPTLMHYMVPLCTVYYLEYLINQGYFELTYFNLTWLTRMEQYRWWQVLYQFGVFVSRSSVSVIQIHKIWILSFFQLINFILFTLDATLFIFPHVAVVIILILWEGLLGGGTYVNTFYRVQQEVPLENRVFAMGFVSLADSVAISGAGLSSIFLHNVICDIPYNRGD